MFKRRVVVTGIGIISPLGLGQKNNWKRLISGESGIDTIKSFDASELTCKIGGEIPLGSLKEGKLDVNEWFDIKDQRKLAKVEQEGMTRILCLLAVAQKEHVENIVDIFKAVGVSQLDCLDIDSLAVINALNNFLKQAVQQEHISDPESLDDLEQAPDEAIAEPESTMDDEVVAIVSIGARSTIINVLKGGIPRFSRNVPISGNNITDVIRSVYKVTVEEAEDIKIEKSKEALEGNEDQEFSDVVHTTVEEIAGEIRRSFDYYKAQHRESVIHRVFLTGGTAKLKDIDVLLSNELSVDVEIADPSYGLLKDMENPELFEENLQEYTVAIGLALRGCATNEDA